LRFRSASALALLVVACCTLGSCAYYNTFYLAQKYYDRGAAGLPYPVEKSTGAASNEFKRSIDYSKKLLAQYPKSKWVDDAYLLWARALLGRDDPLQTVNLLEGYSTRFPNSPLKNDAVFYLGVGYRNARQYENAVAMLDTFLTRARKSDLRPYAQLERARALASLERYGAAAEAATIVIQKYPKSDLNHLAYQERAEARLKNGDFAEAQKDFGTLQERSRTDEERLGYLLRQAECLESARNFDGELKLLENALSYEVEPLRPDSGSVRTPQSQTAGFDRYGRILMRIGTAHLLAGDLDQALAAYRRVVEDYPKTALGAEAQYRIGYAYETLGDDFTAARTEYDKVKEQGGSAGFSLQAVQRAQNLERLEQYRTAAGNDSSGQQSEGGFILAEQYLFQLDKPERALEEYRKIVRNYPGTPAAAKALAAQGWVLSRKLDRKAAADSLFWKVVHEYPATEAQLAARDYLEMEGQDVPAELIKLPEPVAPPPAPQPLPAPAVADTILGPGGGPHGPMFDSRGALVDSLRRARFPAGADSLFRGSPADSIISQPVPTFGDSLRPAPAFENSATMPAPHAPAGSTDTTQVKSTPSAPSSVPAAPPDTTHAPPTFGPANKPAAAPDTTRGTSAAPDSSAAAPDSTSSMEWGGRESQPQWSFRFLGIEFRGSPFVAVGAMQSDGPDGRHQGGYFESLGCRGPGMPR
jgi:tetratricopeptide (TPR) repeat protein